MKPILNQNPLDDGDFLQAIQFILERFKAEFDSCLPVEVVAYDRGKNRVAVKPLINRETVDGGVYERAVIENVQTLANGAGGFVINFPVSRGDKGWIIAADRDISLFKQYEGAIAPGTSRMHSFADCWFIPDVLGNFVIKGEDSGRFVLQDNTGFSRISIGKQDIRIHAGPTKITVTPSSVTVDTDSTTINTKTFELNSDQSTINSTLLTVNSTSIFNGATTINGGLAVNAGAGGSGSGMRCNVDMIVKSIESESFIKGSDGVDLVGHVHDVPQGGETSGPK